MKAMHWTAALAVSAALLTGCGSEPAEPTTETGEEITVPAETMSTGMGVDTVGMSTTGTAPAIVPEDNP